MWRLSLTSTWHWKNYHQNFNCYWQICFISYVDDNCVRQLKENPIHCIEAKRCHKVAPVLRLIRSQGGACIEVHPATRWRQYWGSSCHKVAPVLRFILPQGGACIEVHPATRWRLYWGWSGLKVAPVLRYILPQGGASIEVHPATRWRLYWGWSGHKMVQVLRFILSQRDW